MPKILLSIKDKTIFSEVHQCFEEKGFTITTDEVNGAFDFAILSLNNDTPVREIMGALKRGNPQIKVLFITLSADLEASVHALKNGAFSVLNGCDGADFFYRVLIEDRDSSAIQLPSIEAIARKYAAKIFQKNHGILNEASRELQASYRNLQRKY